MEIEAWKPVIGYEDFYEVSNLGRIKRLSVVRHMKSKVGNDTERVYREKILKPQKCTNDYLFILLSKDKIAKSFLLHRLVAIHFIPNPENKPEVNHKYGDKSDCRASELEWSTASENQKHSYDVLKRCVVRNGHKLRGKNSPTSKKIKQLDFEGKLIKVWDSMGEIERTIGISQSFVSNVCRGLSKSAKGFLFKYA